MRTICCTSCGRCAETPPRRAAGWPTQVSVLPCCSRTDREVTRRLPNARRQRRNNCARPLCGRAGRRASARPRCLTDTFAALNCLATAAGWPHALATGQGCGLPASCRSREPIRLARPVRHSSKSRARPSGTPKPRGRHTMLDRTDLEPAFFAPFVSSVMRVEPAMDRLQRPSQHGLL